MESADEYASADEAAQALAALNDSDIKKLMVSANYWLRVFPVRYGYGEPEDLLQQAALQTLRGKRRWRKGRVSILKHLDRSMESIAKNTPPKVSKDRRAERAAHSLDEPHAKPTGTTSSPHPAPSSTPESQIAAQEELQAIMRLFADDEQGLEVLRCRALGMEASQIQAELGINKTEWETIRKRVQRKLIRYGNSSEEGGPS